LRRKLQLLLEAWKIRLLDALVIGTVLLVAVVLFAVSRIDRSDIAFDATKWRAERPSTCIPWFANNERRRMTADLARVLREAAPKPGKGEIQRLPGDPDTRSSEGLWGYWVGATILDCSVFYVQFDRSDVVAEVYRIKN